MLFLTVYRTRKHGTEENKILQLYQEDEVIDANILIT